MRKTIPLILLVLAGTARAEDRPYLGVGLSAIDADTRAAYEIPADLAAGVVLSEVVEGSAAAGAGFRKGDVMIAFDGKQVNGPDALVELVRSKRPGDSVTYVLRRGSGRIEGTVKLGVRQESEVEVEIAGERVEAPDELEARIEQARRRVAEMQRRVAALAKARATAGSKPGPARRGLEGYLHREELAREKAAAEGDRQAVARHEARMDLLRELIRDRAGDPQLDRIEKRLERILGLLER